MSEIREHVAYLSQTIGPRPAGTEEEQQAALYITERLQAEAELPAVIEDFNCNPDFDIPRAICSGVAVLVAIVALIVPLMVIPAFVVTLLAALLFAAEAFDRPVISRFFNKGVSQNVVAKYEPAPDGQTGQSRRRKIILLAHYDSGKVRKELANPVFKALPALKWVELGAMVLLPVLFLLRCLVSFGGAGLIVVNVITVIVLIAAALPIAALASGRTAAYNEGANCNAAGVAVMMDVASRIGRGRSFAGETGFGAASAEPGFEESAAAEASATADTAAGASDANLSAGENTATAQPVMHGEQALVESGLVPQGAELSYEVSTTTSVAAPASTADGGLEGESPAARLIAAKAAIAALTGKPVSTTVNIELPDEPVASAASSAVAGVAASLGAAAAVAVDVAAGATGEILPASSKASSSDGASGEADEPEKEVSPAEGDSSAAADQPAEQEASSEPTPEVPEWFLKAQQKAKKPFEKEAPVQRSRYADALDAAVRESAAHFQEANKVIESETAMHLRQLRNNIMEVKAPGFEHEAAAEPAPKAAAAPEKPVAPVPSSGSTAAIPAVAQTSTVPAPPSLASAAVQASPVEASCCEQPAAQPQPQPQKPVRSLAGVNIAAISKAAAQPVASADRAAVSSSGKSASQSDQTATSDSAHARSAQDRPAPRRRRAMALPNLDAQAQAASSTAAGAAEAAEFGGKRSLKSLLPSVGMTGSLRTAIAAANGAAGSQAPVSAAQSDDQAELGATTAMDPFEPLPLSAYETESAEAYEADAFASASASSDNRGVYEGDPGYDDYAYPAEDGYDADQGGYCSVDDDSADFGNAGLSYVEVPKSRARSFMDKFRFGRKNKREEAQSSPQEWLDVDDEFDARSAGAARGGWESFQQRDLYDDEDLGATAAFQPLSADSFAADDDFADDAAFEPAPRSAARRWNGGAFSRDQLGRVSTLSEDVTAEVQEEWAGEVDHELEQIYRFRNPEINTEVWFVALGSEFASNGGMRAFLREHAADLKGAVFVELDSLGAGDLRVVSKEGLYRQRTASSRLKRYARKAAQALGRPMPDDSMLWANSSAAYAMQQGCQAIHLAGFADGKPAFFGQANDVLENIDEETLQRNSDFVMELIRQI